MHLPFVNCHQLHICPMPMGHHHPPSTGFSTSSPSISCGRSVAAHTTHVICLLHCGLGCPLHCGWVGVLVVLGDGLGESWLCGRSCSWRYSLLHARFFFLFYLGLTCIMFCQLLSESFEFF